jgi:hypothetical protein
MFLEVKNATYLKNYEIELFFNDGVYKIVDIKNYLIGEVFEKLKDTYYFQNFKISLNTIEWENGADFAPEFLYEIGVDFKK